MSVDVILFICAMIGGVAGLLSIIETIIKAMVSIIKYYHTKNDRPADQAERTE